MLFINLLLYFLFFCFGTIIGSFLNCLLYRLEVNKSFVFGRSICPKCKHELAWNDLIPIFSFVFLGGRCRYCKKRISFQYPLIEIISGILLVALFWYAGPSIELAFLAFIFFCMLAIFIYDLRHFIIPDKILFPLIFATFVYVSITNSIVLPLLSALGAALFFLIIYLASKGKWMGFGDVKLAVFLGLFLSWPNIALGLFLSFVIGAIIGTGLMIFSNKGLKSEVPFGPFLITGSVIAFFWGQEIINWYLNLLGFYV